MKKFVQAIFFIISVQIILAPAAFAVSKLSSSVRKAKPYINAANDYYNAAQETVKEVSTDLLTLQKMAENGELQKKAEKYAEKYAEKKAKGYAKEEIDKIKAKQKQKQLEKKEKELAAAQAQKEAYEASLKEAQQQKNQEIDAQLTALKAQVQVSSLNETERAKLIDEIALLEAQKQQNLDKPLEHDETLKGMQDNEEKLSAEVREVKEEASQTTLQAELEEKIKDLFSEEDTTDEENQAIYKTEIEALFLKDDEESSSENLARIKKNRNMEYYKALQKAMEVAVIGTASSPEIELNIENYRDMANDVDGNFAVKNINIGIIIENAKVAARLTEALLAEIRLKTTQDMVSWNNKNRLYDYNKPITEFDLDYYELKKFNLKDKAKSFYDKNKDNAKGYYDKNKDKIKDLWHKI